VGDRVVGTALWKVCVLIVQQQLCLARVSTGVNGVDADSLCLGGGGGGASRNIYVGVVGYLVNACANTRHTECLLYLSHQE